MLNYIKGDLIRDKQYTVFCHQVNCKGVMGAGIAKQISIAYPEVFREYRFHCSTNLIGLGSNLYVHTMDGRFCVNMFAQDGFGRDKRYTDYDAFQKCLNSLQKKLLISSPDLIVGIPYKIGCGLAGGDWPMIEKMLENFSENVVQKIYIVKKEINK